LQYTHRHLTARVERALKTSRVVNIVGPRQSGKTTLVRDMVKTAYYATMDDSAVLAAFETDPYGQLMALSDQLSDTDQPIALDEIQRLPEITLALKRIVDENRRPGQFLLTGSSDIFTTAAAYDSLAGRVQTLTLRPFSASEIKGCEPFRLLDAAEKNHNDLTIQLPRPLPCDRTIAIDLVVRGGFPEMFHLDSRDRMERYESYVDSIVERDVAPISSIRKPDVLRRLIDQLASRTAEELTVSKLCQVLNTRKETVNDYIDILSRLGIVRLLGAWTSSGAKREIKSPKLHFLDTGCASALRGEDEGSFHPGADPSAFGHLLESFVFSELEKSLPYASKRWRLYHWRSGRQEIDIIAEAPGRRLALFEVKASTSLSLEDFRHMSRFKSEGPGRAYRTHAFCVYLGSDVLSFGPDLTAIPLSLFWSYHNRGGLPS